MLPKGPNTRGGHIKPTSGKSHNSSLLSKNKYSPNQPQFSQPQIQQLQIQQLNK